MKLLFSALVLQNLQNEMEENSRDTTAARKKCWVASAFDRTETGILYKNKYTNDSETKNDSADLDSECEETLEITNLSCLYIFIYVIQGLW